jgi:hypothetical protein
LSRRAARDLFPRSVRLFDHLAFDLLDDLEEDAVSGGGQRPP